jgi:hypothetical protein
VKIAIHIVSLACALLLFLGPVKAQKAGHWIPRSQKKNETEFAPVWVVSDQSDAAIQ